MTEASEVRQRQGENLLVGEVRIFHDLRNPREPVATLAPPDRFCIDLVTHSRTIGRCN